MTCPVWFITGSSTGLGRALAEAVLAHGDRVVATARDPSTLDDLTGPNPDDVVRLRLDVTDPAQVTAAVEEAVRRTGAIDVLVNNAGHGLIGALEELSDEQIPVLDTNVLGVLSVTAAAAIIRAVRDENAPLRLPLGPEAVRRIREKLQGSAGRPRRLRVRRARHRLPAAS